MESGHGLAYFFGIVNGVMLGRMVSFALEHPSGLTIGGLSVAVALYVLMLVNYVALDIRNTRRANR